MFKSMRAILLVSIMFGANVTMHNNPSKPLKYKWVNQYKYLDFTIIMTTSMPNKWISQEFHKISNNYLVCIIMKLFHLPFEVEKWTSLYAIFIGGGMGFIMYFALLVFLSAPSNTCLVKKSFVGIVGLSCFLILGNTIWWKTLTKTSLLCSKHCNSNYYCDENDNRRYVDMR